MSASQAGAPCYLYHGEMWKCADPTATPVDGEVTPEQQAWEVADAHLAAAIDRVMRLQQELRESQERNLEILERLIALMTETPR